MLINTTYKSSRTIKGSLHGNEVIRNRVSITDPVQQSLYNSVNGHQRQTGKPEVRLNHQTPPEWRSMTRKNKEKKTMNKIRYRWAHRNHYGDWS